MRKLILLTILTIIAATSWASDAEASVCQDRKKALPKIEQHCSTLNEEFTLEGNPFIYTNPDAGCDLGLSLPGLPSFRDKSFGLDSCKILKAVTGDLVREVNTGLRNAVDDSLGEIADEYNGIKIDPQSVIEDQL